MAAYSVTEQDVAGYEAEEDFGANVVECARDFYRSKWAEVLDAAHMRATDRDLPTDQHVVWINVYAELLGMEVADLTKFVNPAPAPKR